MKSTTHTLSRLTPAVLVAVALSSAPAAQSGAKYTVVAVGDFGPGTGGSVTDINNANEVIGTYYNSVAPSHLRAFVYRNGMNTDLGTLGGTVTVPSGINDSGFITGTSNGRAFIYHAGSMTDLGAFPGTATSGQAINSLGYVAGIGPGWAAFVWNGANATPLSSPAWASLFPHDINTAGTVVGAGSLAGGGNHGFEYVGGIFRDLAPLSGDPYSGAYGVNDAGTIVGFSGSDVPYRRAAVQWSNGTISSLGNLPGGTESMAFGINAAGVVVGRTADASGVLRAVRWSGGTIVDLNGEIPANSGWFLESARAINDNGAIIGWGRNTAATPPTSRAFLLIPVNDTTPPAISCGAADGLWHAADVSIGCTASDSESGLADPADASFSLSTSVAAGTETANASTGARTVCDNAGNCATAGPIGGNKIDRAAPAIWISNPTATTYQFLSSHIAWYGCADGGSGVAGCGGTVPSGTAIDTVTLGSHALAVTASDAVGNMSAATVQYSVVATNWPQFHNGADRSGVQPLESVLDPTNVGSLGLYWASPTWYPIYASPVVADGVVYVPSSDGQLRAFSAAYGSQLWAVPIGSYLTSTPAVDKGRVFIGSDNGNVYAIDAASGGVLWQFATNGPVYTSPTAAGGLVYVGSWDAHLYALDALTGKVVWQRNVGSPVRSDAAATNRVVYLANDALYAFDARTGAQIWVTAPWWKAGVGAWTVAASKDRVLVGTDDGGVYALDAYKGALLWSAMTTYGTGGIAAIPAIDRKLGHAYVGATDGSLYAFDLVSGALVWSSFLGGWVTSPAVANGVVYAGALDRLHAVDAGTGAILWSAAFGGVVVSSPAVADGTVYIGNTDTYLYAFRR